MSESPASLTPYEVLGVSPSATADEMRRAYRRQLRVTHPDTGGTAARFHDVQVAWELIGDPSKRADYDRGRTSAPADQARAAGAAWSGSTPAHRAEGANVRARSYGYPGGQSRERFLTLIREWSGLGMELTDPYEPGLVRSAPQEIRHALAKALAEEATAREVSTLGIGYTIWNDVSPGPRSDSKIDHIVLGPAGLFAVQSEDWGRPVRMLRGDLVVDGAEAPTDVIHTLGHNARMLARTVKVQFTGLMVVVPDDDLASPIENVARGRQAGALVVRRSLVPELLRNGGSRADRSTVDRVFDLRTRLQEGIRFV